MVDFWAAMAGATRALSARLATLAQTFELLSATSRHEEANAVLCPLLGLPPLPLIEFGDLTSGPGRPGSSPRSADM